MMLRVSGIHAGYGRVEVLKGIDLEINEGEVVCLLGANGAGKSTLLKVISGLITPGRGSITFAGTEDADVILDTVRTAPNQRSMDALQVQVRQQGSTLIIEEKHDQPPFGWAGSATFDVAVPASVRSIDAKSVSGSISVRGLAPGVSQALETVSGRIDTDQAGDLSASTVSGSVSFVFNGARLKAHAVSGSINGAIDGLARDGSAELSSVSGSIALTAWSGLDAQVSLKSLSGSVSCDFPVVVTAQRSNTLQGKIGTGAARMEASTTSGSININRQ